MGCAVLIIEDEPVFAKNIKTYLRRHHFNVRVSTSAEEGLARLKAFRPHAVLLDYQLPAMNGMDALCEIRRIDPTVKVIMITGHGNAELEAQAMKAGAYDFLTKPVSLDKLERLLEKAAGQRPMELG